MEEKGLLWLRWSYSKRKRRLLDQGGAIPKGKKIVMDNWWNLSQGGDCWEIASNSICDLESQLGFLTEEGNINLGFLVVERKTIPQCLIGITSTSMFLYLMTTFMPYKF